MFVQRFLCSLYSFRKWISVSILPRRHAGIFFKYFSKVTLILEAGGDGNINNGIICIDQIFLTFLNSCIIQKFLKSRTGSLLKQCRKIRRIQFYMISGFLQGKRLVIMLGDISDGSGHQFLFVAVITAFSGGTLLFGTG